MTIVILAAGGARRMGQQKLLMPIDGQPMIERIITAAQAWPLVVVAGDAVARALGHTRLCIARNDAPERGMSHSLKLGNALVPDAEPIAVLLADLPDITSASIGRVLDAYDDTVDVVVPRCADRFAHPVVFGPWARQKIAALDDGDTIGRLRDDASLRRRFVETDHSALSDIDTPAEYRERTGQHVDDHHVPTVKLS
jgi:molybdenum cofactor cytidylyltransferase